MRRIPASLSLLALLLGCAPLPVGSLGPWDVPDASQTPTDQPAVDAPIAPGDVPSVTDVPMGIDAVDAGTRADDVAPPPADIPPSDAPTAMDVVVARDAVVARDVLTPLDVVTAVDVVIAVDVPPPDVAPLPVSTQCFNCGLRLCGASGLECTRDPECLRCLRDDIRDPRCVANPALRGVLACACSNCPADCVTECVGVDAGVRPDVPVVVDVPTAADVPFNAAACGSCAIARCPAASARCGLDLTCQRCAFQGDYVSPTCRANGALQAVLSCACTACDSCGPVCSP